jgi:hypothetical protein
MSTALTHAKQKKHVTTGIVSSSSFFARLADEKTVWELDSALTFLFAFKEETIPRQMEVGYRLDKIIDWSTIQDLSVGKLHRPR